IADLKGHRGIVWAATFSPDGRHIVTASFDKTARIWDAKTAEPIAVLKGHRQSVDDAVFSPDGMRIVTASEDWTARIWNNPALHAGDAFAIACKALGNRTDLVDLAQRYRLTELKPICGFNTPSKINLSDIQD